MSQKSRLSGYLRITLILSLLVSGATKPKYLGRDCKNEDDVCKMKINLGAYNNCFVPSEMCTRIDKCFCRVGRPMSTWSRCIVEYYCEKNPDPVPDITTSKPRTTTKKPDNEYNPFCCGLKFWEGVLLATVGSIFAVALIITGFTLWCKYWFAPRYIR